MGAHTRPRHGVDGCRGRHRGASAPLIDVDLGAAALRTGAVLVTGATAATVVVAGAGGALAAGTRPAQPTATTGDFAALRQCESGGHYAIDTHNGFYGAYQFDLRTWHGLGYGGVPSSAAPAVQDRAARSLESQRGWQPWPACSARLGLGRRHASAAPATASAAPATASVHLAGGVPAFGGTVLTTALEPRSRTDVLVWQARMVRRGWHLSVDGSFGPQSSRIAREFVAEKHLATAPGTVDGAAWTAAWTAPITP